MKKSLFSNLWLMLMAAVMFAACSDDDAGGPAAPLQPKADGFYVYGTNTIASAPTEQRARLAGAKLNPAKSGGAQTKPGVYGRYMYIGANSTIQFTEVVNGEAVVLGAAGGGTKSAGADLGNTDINAEFIHGTLEAGAPAIQVDEEGLYYLFVDANTDHFRLMKVDAQIFGDAQPGQWSTGTVLPMKSANKDAAVFEATGVNLTGESGYKYRMNRGYEVYNDGEIATLTFLGVESYGAAWDSGVNDLIYKDENIPQKETGTFLVRLEYNPLTDKWTETKIKDYSATQMSLFGNAFVLPSGEEANWNTGLNLHAPAVEGSVYTWNWDNVGLIEGREFIFLENGAWGGLLIDYTGATVEGAAVTNGNIVDATTVGGEHHNYRVVAGGPYNIKLVIDAAAGTRKVVINPAG